MRILLLFCMVCSAWGKGEDSPKLNLDSYSLSTEQTQILNKISQNLSYENNFLIYLLINNLSYRPIDKKNLEIFLTRAQFILQIIYYLDNIKEKKYTLQQELFLIIQKFMLLNLCDGAFFKKIDADLENLCKDNDIDFKKTSLSKEQMLEITKNINLIKQNYQNFIGLNLTQLNNLFEKCTKLKTEHGYRLINFSMIFNNISQQPPINKSLTKLIWPLHMDALKKDLLFFSQDTNILQIVHYVFNMWKNNKPGPFIKQTLQQVNSKPAHNISMEQLDNMLKKSLQIGKKHMLDNKLMLIIIRTLIEVICSKLNHTNKDKLQFMEIFITILDDGLKIKENLDISDMNKFLKEILTEVINVIALWELNLDNILTLLFVKLKHIQFCINKNLELPHLLNVTNEEHHLSLQ